MTPLAFTVAGHEGGMATLYEADRTSALHTLFVFAHGAGAGQSHPFMVRYARGLAERGLDVVTFDFPYMQARRKAPDRAPVLEEAFRHVLTGASQHRHVRATRLVIGGKSMGGRIATHLAASPEAWPADLPPLTAVVVFGYPLQPPGGSTRSPDRVSHLFRIQAPTLIAQGTRDTFGGPDAVTAALAARPGVTPPPITVYPVPGGDHSLNVGKTRSVDTDVWDQVAAFIRSR